ncbi:zf-HC2 domain-containing protein [Streptomyces meridianus]|uniref:Zf-HC2 domain-containing protein n=1 Tax=Streptomyces meridianus TaxID=2938945 RepID=A0ABT0X2C0_9ACTN|nr:zf-HC2 domain-containing protein [Streptomyces meridianus]MCM2576078.1 zf-HC2 domain-containing protein [Streptomyces meridianus]
MNHRGPTTEWHLPDADVQAYAAGGLPEPGCWSLEKHVEACARCAQRVSDAVRTHSPVVARSLDATRSALLARIGAEDRAGSPARAGGTGGRLRPVGSPRIPAADTPRSAHGRTGGRQHPVRAWGARLTWAAGPALGRSWLFSLTLVTVAAVVLARLADAAELRPLLLVAAPLLPVAGVAVSYGRHADPLYETVAATPSAGLRLLLVRTAMVLAVCVPLLTAAGLLMPAQGGSPGAAAWLLPGLALTLLTLVTGSYLGCLRASAVTGTTWPLLLLTAGTTADPGPADLIGRVNHAFANVASGPAQGFWASAALLCGGLLVLRRTSFDQLERL